MAFDVYASPVPVPQERRGTIVDIPFDTMAQALDSAFSLLRAGWHVYRVTGPDGFELTEVLIDKYCNVPVSAEPGSEEKNGL